MGRRPTYNPKISKRFQSHRDHLSSPSLPVRAAQDDVAGRLLVPVGFAGAAYTTGKVIPGIPEELLDGQRHRDRSTTAQIWLEPEKNRILLLRFQK